MPNADIPTIADGRSSRLLMFRHRTMAIMCWICGVLFAWVLVVTSALPVRSLLIPVQEQYHSSHIDHLRGAVSSESLNCSKIGTDTLLRGGNAADAIVSTALCIGVVAPYHGGFGGGGFMLIRDSAGTYEEVSFREEAPAAAFEEMYENNYQASLTGGLASGVPGELRGLEYLHNKYGCLPWQSLFGPSIDLARNGFTFNEDMLEHINEANDPEFLTDDPVWREVFVRDGKPLGVGDTIFRERYANTLETVAREGADAFYNGDIAKHTINALSKENGTMTLDDLHNYKVKAQTPLSIRYRDFEIYSVGAPAGGSVVLSAMKTVEGYPDMAQPGAVNLSVHRLDEAFKFGFGERTKLGDPEYVAGLEVYQQEMINDTTASRIRGKISDDYVLPTDEYNPDGLNILADKGTAHMVAADSSGLVITLTSTVNDLFGSHLMVPETGVIMNDQMNDFSWPGVSNEFGYLPTPNNYIRPGKRPLSSMSPTLVENYANSTFHFAVGAAGGSFIITSVAQTLWRVLDLGMSPEVALAQPRWHDQLQPNEVEMEWTFDNGTVAFMRSRGHNVTLVEPGITNVFAIEATGPQSVLHAASDPFFQNAGVSIV